jgi:hypothetical protein
MKGSLAKKKKTSIVIGIDEMAASTVCLPPRLKPFSLMLQAVRTSARTALISAERKNAAHEGPLDQVGRILAHTWMQAAPVSSVGAAATLESVYLVLTQVQTCCAKKLGVLSTFLTT